MHYELYLKDAKKKEEILRLMECHNDKKRDKIV